MDNVQKTAAMMDPDTIPVETVAADLRRAAAEVREHGWKPGTDDAGTAPGITVTQAVNRAAGIADGTAWSDPQQFARVAAMLRALPFASMGATTGGVARWMERAAGDVERGQ